MNIPAAFTERTRALLGPAAYEHLAAALQTDAPVSIRLNRTKWDGTAIGTPVPWATDACYLETRPTFTFDPLFHAGCYYVQEASSMFLERVLRTYVDRPVVMLDLCAAPGGKSTLARSVVPPGSLLVANEVMRPRAQVLAENLTKWGDPATIVTNNDPADFAGLEEVFDVLLTDVPCSGEGMFRKDPTAVEEWSTDNVTACWQRQRRILSDIWHMLKPGGLLVYSTCTYNREENEDNVDWIARHLGADVLPVPVDPAWGITGNLAAMDFPVYRFLPHRTRGEGFFLAALRKHGEPAAAVQSVAGIPMPAGDRKKKNRNKGGKTPVAAIASNYAEQWLQQPGRFLTEEREEDMVAFPLEYASLYALLRRHLHIVRAGITLATRKGRDVLPHPSLALSTALKRGAFPEAALDYEQAIAYLRKEAVVLSPDLPRGIVLLTWRGVPLGFAKHVGNRANNLYPQEWRIRSTYLPEGEVRILYNKV